MNYKSNFKENWFEMKKQIFQLYKIQIQVD